MSEGLLSRHQKVIDQTVFSYLYLISEGPEGPIKVGVSSDPKSRLRTLQTGNPRPLKILTTYRFLAADIYDVEGMFHFDFVHDAINGEWFDLSEALLLDCMADFFESNGYQVVA